MLERAGLRLVEPRALPGGAVQGWRWPPIALQGYSNPRLAVLPLACRSAVSRGIDALSALFPAPPWRCAAGISTFASGYLRAGEGQPPGLQCLCYTLSSPAWPRCWSRRRVFSSWSRGRRWRCPRSSRRQRSPARRDPARRYLYLPLRTSGQSHLAVLRRVAAAPATKHVRRNASDRAARRWATVAFLLALAGFGRPKAGVVPLHVWLPEAHPAAPYAGLALMSAVMLKTANLRNASSDAGSHRLPLWWWA